MQLVDPQCHQGAGSSQWVCSSHAVKSPLGSLEAEVYHLWFILMFYRHILKKINHECSFFKRRIVYEVESWLLSPFTVIVYDLLIILLTGKKLYLTAPLHQECHVSEKTFSVWPLCTFHKMLHTTNWLVSNTYFLSLTRMWQNKENIPSPIT